MTSTPPRASGAAAHAACNSPRGPAQVIGVVGTVFSDPGGGALTVAGSLDGDRGVRGRLLVLAAGGDQGGRSRGADAEQGQSAQGFASGQQPVNMIGGDFFGDIPL